MPVGAARLPARFSPWVFVICAGADAPVMLCFSELSSPFGDTGGPVRYAGSVFGRSSDCRRAGPSTSRDSRRSRPTLDLLVGAVGYFWPAADDAGVRIGLLAALTAAMAWVNVVGARAAMASLGTLTLLKLLPLLALAIYGASQVGGAHPVLSAPPPASELGAGLLLVIYAFVGFESSVVPAGEARNPQRDMPRALLWASVLWPPHCMPH